MARALAAAAAAVVLGAVMPAGSTAEKPPRKFYGVSGQMLPTAADIDRMRRGKVGTLRFELRWSAVDTLNAHDPFDWSEPDRVVAAAARRRLHMLPFLYSTPQWVATALDGYSGCATVCGFHPPRSNAALDRWAAFVRAAVDRYGPGGDFWAEHPGIPPRPIRTWQIWNEPNSPTFFRPRPDVGQYARMLASASAAIRRRDQDAKLIVAGMFGWPHDGEPPAMTTWEFLAELFANRRARGSFDHIAVHPYAQRIRGVKDQMRRTLGLLRRQPGPRMPMWVTELGWASGDNEHPFNLGKRGQGKRLHDSFRYLTAQRRRLGLRGVIWYSWRDNPAGTAAACAWCSYSGLFEGESLTPKPAWRRFIHFTGGR